jgi:L-alanine-DL-glutamate epimerase-like enolase superfamily enzyme
MTRFIWGVIPAQAISVAANLGIADLLAKEPKTADELSRTTMTDAAALGRLLRMLTGLAIFAEDAAGRFLNTPLSETLGSDHPHSVRALAILWGAPFFWKPCGGNGCGIVVGASWRIRGKQVRVVAMVNGVYGIEHGQMHIGEPHP